VTFVFVTAYNMGSLIEGQALPGLTPYAPNIAFWSLHAAAYPKYDEDVAGPFTIPFKYQSLPLFLYLYEAPELEVLENALAYI
jgi:hypothetical protein